MASPPVVLDTMVLLRIFTNRSPYVEVLERIKEECNKIVFSTPIIKEWRTKAYATGMSASILVRKLEGIEQIKKLKKCKRTSIRKAQKLINGKRCRKPVDSHDLKFVEVALAEKAVIVTKDTALLNMNPYNCGKVNLKIQTPEAYLGNS